MRREKLETLESCYIKFQKLFMNLLREKLPLKRILIMLVFLCFGCVEKETNFYKTIDLKDGLPDGLKSLEKDLPFKNFRYASLNTGTDTIQVYFGSLTQGTNKGHWFGIESNGQPAHFSTVILDETDTLDYPSKDIEIEFNNEMNRVALRVIQLDSLKVKYSWLNNLELSKNIALKSIEKPLRLNSQFPYINLESLGGERFSSNDFKDQFIVINWWATSCAPCIKEIPGLNDLVEKYNNNKNVRFIAITDDPQKKIMSFLKNKDFKYEMTFADSETRNLFGNSYPINIIIDHKGKITYLKKGAGSQTPFEIELALKQQLEMYTTQEISITE